MTLEELAKGLSPYAPLVGLDLGTKTIGLSVGTISTGMAFPRPVLKRKKFTLDAEKLITFLKDEQIVAAIIGLPLNMDGSEGPRCQATRAFVRNMEKLTDTPFIFWDERLSTVAAERSLLEMDVSRANRAQRIDSAAASFILQGALDRLDQLCSSSSS